LDFLWRCLPARIKCALNKLPETLDDTYKCTLLEISNANRAVPARLGLKAAALARPEAAWACSIHGPSQSRQRRLGLGLARLGPRLSLAVHQEKGKMLILLNAS
jgi:hypothetical protein